MHADEGDVKAANEGPGGQQPEAAIPRREAQLRPEAELAGGHAAAVQLALRRAQEPAAGDDDQRQQRHQNIGGRPAPLCQEHLADGHHGELAGGAAGGDQAQAEGAAFVGEGAGDGAQHHAQGTARLRQTDQQAGGNVEGQRVGDIRHDVEARGIEPAAEGNDPPGAEFLGDAGGERLERAPQEVLQRHAEGEDLAPPVQVQAHGLQVETERGANPHAENDADGAGGEDRIGQAVGFLVGGHGRSLCSRTLVARVS